MQVRERTREGEVNFRRGAMSAEAAGEARDVEVGGRRRERNWEWTNDRIASNPYFAFRVS